MKKSRFKPWTQPEFAQLIVTTDKKKLCLGKVLQFFRQTRLDKCVSRGKKLPNWRTLPYLGRGGGLVVSVLAFYSDDLSSIPAGYLNFLYKKTKINEKEAHLYSPEGLEAPEALEAP